MRKNKCYNQTAETSKEGEESSKVIFAGSNNQSNSGDVDVTGLQELERHHKNLIQSRKCDILKPEVDEGIADSTSSFRGIDTTLLSQKSECFFVFSESEIKNAFKKICSGKRKFKKPTRDYEGIEFLLERKEQDKNALSRFCEKKDFQIKDILNDLQANKYSLTPYVGIKIPKKNKKDRGLLIPSPRDRVLFTATLTRLLLSVQFLNDYNVFGSHQHSRLKTQEDLFRELLKNTQKFKYVLKVDITDFFPSIDREKLFQIIDDIKIDDSLKNIIRKSIANSINYNKKDESVFEAMKVCGIPQGCAFSPLLSNLYALPLDRYLKENSILSYRYLDDMIVYTNSKREAEKIFKELVRIASSIKLNIHSLESEKSEIIKTTSRFEYLGVEFNNGTLFIPDSAIKKFEENIKLKCSKKTLNIDRGKVINEGLIPYIRGWKEFYSIICRVHFKKIRDQLNLNLEKYYKKKLKEGLIEEKDLRNKKIYL